MFASPVGLVIAVRALAPVSQTSRPNSDPDLETGGTEGPQKVPDGMVSPPPLEGLLRGALLTRDFAGDQKYFSGMFLAASGEGVD